jgi:hypothetical protein
MNRRPRRAGFRQSTSDKRIGSAAVDRIFRGKQGGAGGSDPTAVHSGDTAGGDLGGSYPNPTVSSARVRSDEPGLKIIRGIIDTTGAGSIVEGIGFSIARNGVGDLTITYTDDFSDVPSVDLTAVGAGGTVAHATIYSAAARTPTSVRVYRTDGAGAAADGVFDFTATGPA